MITSVISSPTVWSPAYNPIIWMVASDQVGQFKFKYVFDVFIGGATAGIRYKVPPNPSGVGIIDVSSIAQTQITINENLPMLSSTPFYSGAGLATQVYLRAGEEYSLTSTGPVSIYDGFGDVGTPSYGLYADDNFRPTPNSTTPVIAYAAAQSASAYYDYRSTGGEDILEYEMGLGGITPDTSGEFLTNCPLNPQPIRSDEDFTLTWIRNLEANVYQTFPLLMRVSLYDGGTGGILNHQEDFNNTVANGGYWQSLSVPPSGTGPSGSIYMLESFYANVTDLLLLTGDPTDTICFELFPSTGGTGVGPNSMSQSVCLTIDDDNCWGFDPIRFTWLNPLGGRDWYTFIKRNTNTQSANRQTFYQLPGYWSGSSFPITDISPARYGSTVYNVQLENNWTASTDWISGEESEWLRNMFASPSVHAYLPGRTQPTLVTITDGSYETQSFARQKLFQYFVSFTEAQSDTVQGY